MKRSHSCSGATVTLSLCAPCVLCMAQVCNAADVFPTRAIRMIVPFTSGGAAEIIARLMGARMTDTLGQSKPIARAKGKPNGLAYGTAGQGTSGHLAVELISYRAGIQMLHVPYKGAGQALIDLMGGQVQLVCTSTLPALPHVRSGQLRALAVTTASRTRAAPDVPTVAEAADLPGYRASTWYAIFAPARTPPPVIQTLHRAAVQALKHPQVVEQLAAQGGDAIGNSPDELRKFLQNEIDVWSKVIKQAGIKPAN